MYNYMYYDVDLLKGLALDSKARNQPYVLVLTVQHPVAKDYHIWKQSIKETYMVARVLIVYLSLHVSTILHGVSVFSLMIFPHFSVTSFI